MEPEVIVTDRIKTFLENTVSEVGDSSREFTEIENNLKNSDTKHIQFRLLKYAVDACKKKGQKTIYLNELLKESGLHLPSVKPTPRNPELETRIQKLKAQQANREYKKMVENVDKTVYYERESIGKEVKALNAHIWSMVNFFVTVGGAFAFGYKATEYAYTGTGAGNKFAFQMVNGLVLATIVFFADLYFLIKYS